jgi:hypothetical protein
VPQDKQPENQTTAKGLLTIAAACAALSVLALLAASHQPRAVRPYKPDYKEEARRDRDRAERYRLCDSDLEEINGYPSTIRAATTARGWLLFDQRREKRTVGLTLIQAPDAPGGRAETIAIERREPEPNIIGVSMVNLRQIEPEKTVIVDVWLRAQAGKGRTDPVVVEGRIQENDSRFRNLKTAQFRLTPKFTKYELSAVTDATFCPEQLNFALHLATGPQTIDIGPATLRVAEAR